MANPGCVSHNFTVIIVDRVNLLNNHLLKMFNEKSNQILPPVELLLRWNHLLNNQIYLHIPYSEALRVAEIYYRACTIFKNVLGKS